MEEKVIWGIVIFSFLNIYSDLIEGDTSSSIGKMNNLLSQSLWKICTVVKLGIEKVLAVQREVC